MLMSVMDFIAIAGYTVTILMLGIWLGSKRK